MLDGGGGSATGLGVGRGTGATGEGVGLGVSGMHVLGSHAPHSSGNSALATLKQASRSGNPNEPISQSMRAPHL